MEIKRVKVVQVKYYDMYKPTNQDILDLTNASTLVQASKKLNVTPQAINKWLTKGMRKKKCESIFGEEYTEAITNSAKQTLES